jgi:hypothetical protein
LRKLRAGNLVVGRSAGRTGDKVRLLNRILLSVTVISVSRVSAYAQSVELGEARLLNAADGSAQSAVFEMVNNTDETIRLIAVNCQLLEETGRTVAVKGVRFRNVPPGSTTGDAAFPIHIRGTDVTCRILHQRREQGR